MNTTIATIANPIFIDAAYNHGLVTVSVYNTIDRSESEVCHFANAANALNYAFLLKKRHGLLIARRAMELIKWVIDRTGAISTRAAARKAAEQQAPSLMSVDTALMTAWESMKSKYPDAVALTSADGLYVSFCDDANEIAAILGIEVETRANDSGEPTPQVSFSADKLDIYLPKLIKAGLRMALPEEDEKVGKKKGKKKATKNEAA